MSLLYGPGAGRRVEIGLRLVQIVDDRRVPLERLLRHRLRQLEELAHAVAVVVVLHVLAPVHQRQPRVALRALLVEVVGVDLLLAAVDFDDRRDQRDDVVADVLDERRLLDDEAVGQLDQHLGAAGLRRVHAADRVVDRLGRVQQLLRARFGRLARIGQLAEHVAILVELLDRVLAADREQDDVAPFFGGADLPVLRAGRRRLRQRLVIAVDVLRVGQLTRRADGAAEELERRGHGVGRRQVIDQLGGDARILQVLLDRAACTPRRSSGAAGFGRLGLRGERRRGQPSSRRRRSRAARRARACGSSCDLLRNRSAIRNLPGGAAASRRDIR